MSSTIDPNTYNVEVSGWTANDDFFVVKTIMQCQADYSKQLFLRQPLRNGSVIFVRWVDPITGNNCFPVAYQIVNIRESNQRGLSRIDLQQIYPKASPEVVPQGVVAAVGRSGSDH